MAAWNTLPAPDQSQSERILSYPFTHNAALLVIYRWNGEAWEHWGEGLPFEEAFFDVKLGQIDGVGPLELVLAGKHGITIVQMTERGRFERIGRIPETEGVVRVGLADITKDGREEILAVGFGGIRVLEIMHLGETL